MLCKFVTYRWRKYTSYRDPSYLNLTSRYQPVSRRSSFINTCLRTLFSDWTKRPLASMFQLQFNVKSKIWKWSERHGLCTGPFSTIVQLSSRTLGLKIRFLSCISKYWLYWRFIVFDEKGRNVPKKRSSFTNKLETKAILSLINKLRPNN